MASICNWEKVATLWPSSEVSPGNSNVSLVWRPLLQKPPPSPNLDVSEKPSELSTQKSPPGPRSVPSDSRFRHRENKHLRLVLKTDRLDAVDQKRK